MSLPAPQIQEGRRRRAGEARKVMRRWAIEAKEQDPGPFRRAYIRLACVWRDLSHELGLVVSLKPRRSAGRKGEP